jgi:ssDNA-binding protein
VANKSLILPKAILSYPWIDSAQPVGDDADAGAKPKFGGVFVFTPAVLADPKEKARYDALVAAAVAAIDEKWPGKRDALLKSENFKKGFRKDAKPGYPEGSIWISARSDRKPSAVYSYEDPNKPGKPAQVPADKIKETFFAGAIVRASVSVFAFDKKGNKGVSFGLNNIQFLKAGERLDNRVAAEDEFDVDLTETPISDDALAGLI